MSILIVEDNPVSVKVLDLNLRKQGYDTVMAKSGIEALEKMESDPDIELIISDIMMPEMNGIQLLGKIKTNPNWQDIPVIMCTAMADMDVVKKAVEMGCKHYVVKPLNIGQMLAKVKEVLRNVKPVISSKDKIMAQLNLDEESFSDIIHSFLDLLDAQIHKLDSIAETNLSTDTITNMSDLYESASILGAVKITETIDAIREVSKHGDRDELRKAGGHLLFECKNVKRKLEEKS